MAMKRAVFIHQIDNALVTDPEYPACKVNGGVVYDEQIMSMPDVIDATHTYKSVCVTTTTTTTTTKGHYMFFIFNLTNYYHFVYDTLPYLHHYLQLLKEIPSCKLLLPANCKFLKFQTDTWDILNIRTEQCIIAKHDVVYEHLYIPSSLTHGRDSVTHAWMSNSMPSSHSIWWAMCDIPPHLHVLPQKIYVSRRSWVHGDLSNIGTNYTSRRRCINEDEVVQLVQMYGYTEIFCECLTMREKINLFKSATHVVGFIGGGMCNVLFSAPTTVVGCIETPEFLRINGRFKHSMNHTQVEYLPCTQLAPYEGPFPLYTRVKKGDIVGEIAGVQKISEKWECILNVAKKPVAGFDLSESYYQQTEVADVLTPLDGGLNSPFVCNTNCLKKWLEMH